MSKAIGSLFALALLVPGFPLGAQDVAPTTEDKPAFVPSEVPT